jgi:hypothetical protein
LPRFELVPAKAGIKRPIRNGGPFCFCITLSLSPLRYLNCR